MSNQELINAWLDVRLCKVIAPHAFAAWLIGSAVNGASGLSDYDVFIIVERASAVKLAQISSELRKTFALQFGLTLHLTRLIPGEILECRAFLSGAFSQGVTLIHESDLATLAKQYANS